jgi:hypothetical protein
MAAKKHPTTIKQEAMRLVNALPATATWDDLMYQIYVREKIETGLADLSSKRSTRHSAIRRRFNSVG